MEFLYLSLSFGDTFYFDSFTLEVVNLNTFVVQISTLNVLDGGMKDKGKAWDYEYRHLLKKLLHNLVF